MRNVCDFGVVGDGEADDTGAIQHAVEQQLVAVYLPPGDYRIGHPIVLDLAKCARFPHFKSCLTSPDIICYIHNFMRRTFFYGVSCAPNRYRCAGLLHA